MLPPRKPANGPRTQTKRLEPSLEPRQISKLPSAKVNANNMELSFYYRENPAAEYLCCLVHGAGQSGAGFMALAHELPDYSVFCPDLRGHGLTWRESDSADHLTDLRIETLVEDLCSFVVKIREMFDLPKQLILVGHSMGGAVVAKAGKKLQEILKASDPADQLVLTGVVLLDVCEEMALNSMGASRIFAQKLPPTFPSIEDAIEWSVQHTVSNRKSANLSIPPTLRQKADGTFTWKLPLLSTETFWKGWFLGMNASWLSTVAHHKILVSSGFVDQELFVAQMKGQIQIEIIQKSGHLIHEDQTAEVGQIIRNISIRQKSLQKILQNQN